MAHYALIDSENIVVNVFVGRDENDTTGGVDNWESYYSDFHHMNCRRTSYNTYGGVHYDPETGEPSDDQSKALRFNYAGIGFTYDAERDAFIPPKPFDSWVINESTCLWAAPVAYPRDGSDYIWNEETASWEPMEAEVE